MQAAVVEAEPEVDDDGPQRGEILYLNEGDYRFGTGPIVVQIEQVLMRRNLSDGVWWYVRAKQLDRPQGPDPGGSRQILVRGRRVAPPQ